jgi:uncharacterized protein YjiS (DUF1127 family)
MLNYAIAPVSADKKTGITSHIATFAAMAGYAVWRWYRRRVTIHKLQSLDDRMLKDIGLDRSEIESTIFSGRHDRHPSHINFDLYRHGR